MSYQFSTALRTNFPGDVAIESACVQYESLESDELVDIMQRHSEAGYRLSFYYKVDSANYANPPGVVCFERIKGTGGEVKKSTLPDRKSSGFSPPLDPNKPRGEDLRKKEGVK